MNPVSKTNPRKLLPIILNQVIKKGHLTFIDAKERRYEIGQKGEKPRATMRLHSKILEWKLALNSDLYLGEAYMDGSLTVEDCTLYDLLEVFAVNMTIDTLPFAKLRDRLAPLLQFIHQYNPLNRAQTNVAHHYDLSEKLYDLFLDEDRQYSCAYFDHSENTIDEAQLNKKRHIAAKLHLKPGMKILDIGSGWGGMAIYLATTYDVNVTGITLSVEQQKLATERVKNLGLSHRIKFLLKDYRDEVETYDRIVSVGMFEHVGTPHYPEFFKKIEALLRPDGVAILHSIGRVDGPGVSNAWLRKYIFPGGYAPALSEVLPVIEKSRLWVTDIEILRMHYARTLAHWSTRFQAARTTAAQIYDERFCRMWEFYLYGCEVDFRYMGTMVFQIQLTRTIDALPFTRDYMFENEKALHEI